MPGEPRKSSGAELQDDIRELYGGKSGPAEDDELAPSGDEDTEDEKEEGTEEEEKEKEE